MFIVGRFVAGFGAAGVSNGSMNIVSNCAPLEKRPGEQDHLRYMVNILTSLASFDRVVDGL